MNRNYFILPAAKIDFTSWDSSRGSSLSESCVGKDLAQKLSDYLAVGRVVCVSSLDKIRLFAMDKKKLKSKILSVQEQPLMAAGIVEVYRARTEPVLVGCLS